MTLSEAYHVLGLAADATPAEVKAAYRRRVTEAHPDQGGSAAEFIKVRAAYEILLAFLEQTAPEATREGARREPPRRLRRKRSPSPRTCAR